MMKGKVRYIIISICVLLAAACAAAGYYLTRPSVVFISPDMPDGFSLRRPSFFTPSFRLASTPGSADFVIVMPSEIVPESEGTTVLFGRSAEEGENPDIVLVPDLPLMWMTALSDRRECILYESSDQMARKIAEKLTAEDGNAYEVTYSGRISVANHDEIASAISGADAVFYLTPSSSLRILRDSDIPAVLDSIHAGALEITGISGAVGVDWDRTIENLISGSASISYAFFPSED